MRTLRTAFLVLFSVGVACLSAQSQSLANSTVGRDHSLALSIAPDSPKANFSASPRRLHSVVRNIRPSAHWSNGDLSFGDAPELSREHGSRTAGRYSDRHSRSDGRFHKDLL